LSTACGVFYYFTGKLEKLSKSGKSQVLKNKWSNISKKGKEKTTATERNLGLSSAGSERAASGRGILAAATSRADSSSCQAASHSVTKVTSLPAVCV